VSKGLKFEKIPEKCCQAQEHTSGLCDLLQKNMGSKPIVPHHSTCVCLETKLRCYQVFLRLDCCSTLAGWLL